MLFITAIIPIVIYILVVYKIDHFSLISIKRLVWQVVWGMTAAGVCFALFQLTGQILSDNQSEIVNPVMEEIIKGIPLLWLATRKRIVFFIDSVICGAAVGAGFSILENLLYLLLGNEIDVATILFRSLEVALIHMGCSAIVAASMMLGMRLVMRHRSGSSIAMSDILMTVFMMLAPAVLHVCHNMFHFNPLVQFVFVFGTLAGLLVWIYYYDVEMIHSWLDTGLDKQLNLLNYIRNGHLNNTPTGTFLESVKAAFPPEEFFDVICYVQLHVELSVASRSRVLLRESGLEHDLPLTDKQKALILSQYTEYKFLEKSMGNTARMTIAPIVKYDPAEYKALEDLRKECRQ